MFILLLDIVAKMVTRINNHEYKNAVLRKALKQPLTKYRTFFDYLGDFRLTRLNKSKLANKIQLT